MANKRNKATKVVLAIIITLAVVAGLFVLRTYLQGAGISIFAVQQKGERVLKYKSVKKGDFDSDKLTGVHKKNLSGGVVIMMLTDKKLTGTVKGTADLKTASVMTKVTAGVIPYPGWQNVGGSVGSYNLDVQLSSDNKTWTKSYSSYGEQTIDISNIPKVRKTRYRYVRYTVTLNREKLTDKSPVFSYLSVSGFSEVQPTATPTESATETATITASATGTASVTATATASEIATATSTTTTPPTPPGPIDTVTPPIPPTVTTSETPITPDLTETPEETATVTETASATATATTVATNVFNSPGSSLLVSGIQSGISFTVIIIIILGIGGFVIYRIIKE